MRVLIANPPCREDIDEKYERFFVRAGSRWPFSVVKKKTEKMDYVPFPFYLAYTAALLEHEKFDVSVIDAIPLNMTLSDFVDRATSIRPDIILFETATPTIYQDLKIAQLLKERTSALIALSGAHVTTFPKETLEESEYIDYILTREYELNFTELVTKLNEGNNVSDVQGLAYRNQEQIRINPNKGLIDLERLPFPARHLFPSKDRNDLNLYWDGFCQSKPAIQMHSSRGCPFHCNFCLWNQVIYQNGKYRMFTPERVVDEMEEVIEKYGAREIYFDDDTFTANKKHVISICGEIEKRGLNVKWSCMGDAIVTDEEMLEKMVSTGCNGIKFGVESGDSNILKQIGKPVDLNRVRTFSKLCAERGIKTHATFTFGLSGETTDTMTETLEIAKELDVDSVQFSITTPFPGTRYYEELDKNGLLITKQWNKYDGSSNAVIDFENNSLTEIEEFCHKASGRWLRHKVKDLKWIHRQIHNLNRIRQGQGNLVLINKMKRVFQLINS